jgi:hypothetical protein
MSNLIQSPVPPDLRALLDSFKVEIFANFNSAKVGTIAAFDATNGPKASVQISSVVPVNGEQLAYPLLTDCPVIVVGGGGGALTFPIAVGDPCLVLFNDFDLDVWFTSGNTTEPNTSRTHSLSDGIVLVGVHNLANQLDSYSASNVQLRFQGATVELSANGDATVSVGTGKTISLITGDGGQIQVNTKVRIGNGATNLLVVLSDLITTLKAWVNTGGTTPNGATITALSAVQTEISSLLQ